MAISLNGIGIDLSGGTAASSTRAASVAASSAKDSASSQTPESDITITSTASLLARLQQAFAAQSPVDSKQVDAISRALAAGNYTVHADRIATGLIHVERALGQLTEI